MTTEDFDWAGVNPFGDYYSPYWREWKSRNWNTALIYLVGMVICKWFDFSYLSIIVSFLTFYGVYELLDYLEFRKKVKEETKRKMLRNLTQVSEGI